MSWNAKANHRRGSQGKPNSRFHPQATKNGCNKKQCAPPITLFVPTFIAGLPSRLFLYWFRSRLFCDFGGFVNDNNPATLRRGNELPVERPEEDGARDGASQNSKLVCPA